MARIDERNIMFSRITRIPGTKEYEKYYKSHPENKEIDDAIRAMGSMNSQGSKFFHKLNSPIVDASFEFLADIKGLVGGGIKAGEKVEGTSEEFTRKLKGLGKFYGANLVGVAELDENYYYTYRGRTDEVYGEKVEANLPYTFVFAVEMNPAYINTAPLLSQSIQVTKGYLDTAIIGMIIAYYIKSLGYEARNHMDGNYLMVLPLAAKAAGLGDIGRHGLLVTPEYGSRIRLGAVTTDMPLLKSEPSLLNIKDFCEICGRCGKLCPSKAISEEAQKSIDGVKRWQIKQEQCFKKWMEFGTDCGICIASCPFSLPMEKNDIEKYYKNSKYTNEILKKYNITDYRKKIDEEQLEWLK